MTLPFNGDKSAWCPLAIAVHLHHKRPAPIRRRIRVMSHPPLVRRRIQILYVFPRQARLHNTQMNSRGAWEKSTRCGSNQASPAEFLNMSRGSPPRGDTTYVENVGPSSTV